MQQQRLNIKLLGFLIAIFAVTHLFLNLYLVILPSILGPNEVRKIVQTLSRMFGPIAIREDMNMAMLSVKIMVSTLFLSSAIGLIRFKEWSRRLLFCLLAARILYGLVICISYSTFLMHAVIIILVGLFLFYYLTRPGIKEQFE